MTRTHRQRLAWLAIVTGLLALAATLVLMALRNNLTFFYTPSQVHTEGIQAGKAFRMGGQVEAGSLRMQPDNLTVRFVVTDNRQRIPVVYEGLLPDLFGENKGVVASGRLDGQGVFKADQILAKHDETYQPPSTNGRAASLPSWLAGNP